ncbi:MAG: DUF1963 domain-containing protein [Leptospirales bacterium]|nr:DUF1963 domain-containing protein [Leptospirales bacterium]
MPDSNGFVQRLVDLVKNKKFADYIKDSPETVAESLRGRHVFVSAEFGEGEPEPGQSKVGGKPDLPEKVAWPAEYDSESPLAFIAQINLAEVHPHDLVGRLPEKGMLWFFTIADGDRAYGEGIDEATSALLYDANPGPLSPREIPAELDENEYAMIEERALEFGAAISLSGYHDRGITDRIVDALREIGGRYGPVHMLTKHHAEDGSEMVSLIDMNGYEISSDVFIEGILEFVLSDADLAAGKLELASCKFTPGT